MFKTFWIEFGWLKTVKGQIDSQILKIETPLVDGTKEKLTLIGEIRQQSVGMQGSDLDSISKFIFKITSINYNHIDDRFKMFVTLFK